MAREPEGDNVVGQLIKEVYKNSEDIADLHACLTSPRGDNFRFRLLQSLEVPMPESDMERLRIESGVNEYHRHLNRILGAGLARVDETGGESRFIRTELGETAVNSVRSFARRVGEGVAQVVFAAALGPNSIRFFPRIYDDKREPDWDNLQIKYTAAEIGADKPVFAPDHRRHLRHRQAKRRGPADLPRRQPYLRAGVAGAELVPVPQGAQRPGGRQSSAQRGLESRSKHRKRCFAVGRLARSMTAAAHPFGPDGARRQKCATELMRPARR